MSVSRGSLGSMRPETAIPTQAPVDLPAPTSRKFDMTLAADTACRQAELLVGLNEIVLRNETDSIHPITALGMRIDLR